MHRGETITEDSGKRSGGSRRHDHGSGNRVRPGGGTASAAASGAALHGAQVMGIYQHGANVKPASTVGQLYYHGGVGGSGVETGTDEVYVVWWGSQWNGNTIRPVKPRSAESLQPRWWQLVEQLRHAVLPGSRERHLLLQWRWHAATNPERSAATGLTARRSHGASPDAPSRARPLRPRPISAIRTTPRAKSSSPHLLVTAKRLRHAVVRVSQLDRQRQQPDRVHQSAVHHRCRRQLRRQLQRPRRQGRHHHRRRPRVCRDRDRHLPNGGWLDSSGEENGDKCAWITSGQGASANVTMNGVTFPVQSLWSNNFNNQTGGCVLSYP